MSLLLNQCQTLSETFFINIFLRLTIMYFSNVVTIINVSKLKYKILIFK